jgi:hypothetical protein
LLGVGFFFCEADVRFNVAGDGVQFIFGGNLFFGALAIAEDGLRFFLFVPEIWLSDAGFEGFQTFAELRRVKDNSGRARCVA